MEKTLIQPSTNDEGNEFNGYQLYSAGAVSIPKLLSPFLQTTGLASVVGESDSGKSTFLRQLAISIALKLEEFLGFKINGRTNKVIYVSTEDDPDSIRYTLKQQVDSILSENKNADVKSLENIQFIFDTHNLVDNLNRKLAQDPADLIIIDAFTDVFDKELNANTQVRTFLNTYDKIAKKHKCLIIFLHHITKSGSQKAPSKNNIIGSQGFEAKMRVVLEIRPMKLESDMVKLMVLKANFLKSQYKKSVYKLKMSENLVFEKVGVYNRTEDNDRESIPTKKTIPKSKDPTIIDKIKELKEDGLTDRAIANKLKKAGLEISKSTVNSIVLEQGFTESQSPKE